MSKEVTIYEVSSDAIKKSDWPRWKFCYGKNKAGLLFFPAALFGDESLLTLLVGHDATPCFTYKNHLFINHEWLLKEQKGKALDLVKALIGVARN